MTARLFQAEVPKTSDARVTLAGTRVFASEITTAGGAIDWRRADWDAFTHTALDVPDPIRAGLIACLARFGLAFGCLDFALHEDGGGGLVAEQLVQLGGFGGGVAEAAADGLDRDAGVDELGGVGVAQLVNVDLDASLRAVGLPAVVGGVVGQRTAAAVDGGAKQRPSGVTGAGQVELGQGDVAAVVQQDGAYAAALAVNPDVLVIQPQVQVLDVETAHFGGAGAADVGGLAQRPVAQPVQRQVLARPP
nr:hypothetical protein [Nonomuraea deserti]